MKVENIELDIQQTQAIALNPRNHLVIAGAGTGKTTTIIGRIKHLLDSSFSVPFTDKWSFITKTTDSCTLFDKIKFSFRKLKPTASNILVLSFTNVSATEMSERIEKETGQPIETSTFHKLGLNIIKECEGKAPKITGINLPVFIKSQLKELIKSPKYYHSLLSYIYYHSIVAKSRFEFDTKEKFEEYLNLNPPITWENQRLKSYGELDIANFLSLNNVRYEYEKPYKTDTRTGDFAQYKPDFYLPDYGIYIEYFAINKNGEVPSYFNARAGLTPSETYKQGMQWKRQLHKKNGTKLIECFSYEKFANKLLPNLETALLSNGVVLKPKPLETIANEIARTENSIEDVFVDLIATVINLIKSNNYSIEQVQELISQEKYSQSANTSLINLIEPIFNAYQQALTANNEIDFNDMINIATHYVKEGRYKHNYKFVIVDEYQDISKSRHNLLKALRDQSDYFLFCVGDDWQSIYRFAGSDIGFILDFEKYWSKSTISKIETTYRFSQNLTDVASSFIMQNPNQVKKAMKGDDGNSTFPVGELNAGYEKGLPQMLAEKLLGLPENSSVFLLGRYNFDIKLFKQHSDFATKYDRVAGNDKVCFKKRPDLDIVFLTAHRSKGLQADYVFILNNKDGRTGFPSKIQDAPIIELLLENSDQFPHAEERRLFYVAITRAREKVFLLTLGEKPSEFVVEFRKANKEKWIFEVCPICGSKTKKYTGPYGEFIGCVKWATDGCKYTRKP